MRFKKKNLLFEERIKSEMPVPNEVKQIHSLFKKNGFKLFIVGGAVRDTLLGKPIKDYDLATDAPPETVDNMLRGAGIKTIGTGAKFGVINAFVNGEEYEIATFRSDEFDSDEDELKKFKEYLKSLNNGTLEKFEKSLMKDWKEIAKKIAPNEFNTFMKGKGRRPDSVIFSDIETDVKRRDLTINALFYDIASKEIVDLVGGMEDIKNGVVRTVGDANERFGEDRLRILRAIRFAGRTGSKLDPAIDKALRNDNSLEGISGERIMDEFLKGINSAKSTKYFLTLLDKYSLFDWIFKGISPINKQFVDENNEILAIAVLLKGVQYDTIGKKLNALKYSSNKIKEIVFLVAFNQVFSEDTFYVLKKMHGKSGVSSHTFLAFAEAMGIDIQRTRDFINFSLSITGDFVKEKYGLKDGPELGVKIKELETNKFFLR
jgi:tRNA nucleotidyltransferase/poly(A) polymerase